MRILIDALAVLPGINGGAATYVSGVVHALVEFSAGHQYLVLGTAESRSLFPPDGDNLTLRSLRLPRGRIFRLLYEQFMLPLVARKWKADVVFFPGNMSSMLLPRLGIPSTVTIHDGSPDFYARHFPGYFPRWKGRIQKYLARWAAQEAAAVLTNSSFARQEVAAYTGVAAANIQVVPPGCPRVQPPDAGLAALARHYRFGMPYLFMLGGSNKHKNYDSAVTAFVRVKRTLDLPHHLLLAGPRGNGYEDLRQTVRNLRAGDDVHLLGYVPSGHLATLYQGADLFVMPSLYEGFGFPVLEAMELGVPVLASHCASLPEVAGDAALYFDGDSVESLTEAMGLAITNPGLRRELAAKGKARAAQFVWEKTAARILECCASCCPKAPASALVETGPEVLPESASR